MTTKSLHPETIALHGGSYRKDENTNSVAVPIYQTTSYQFNSQEHASNLFSLKYDINEKIAFSPIPFIARNSLINISLLCSFSSKILSIKFIDALKFFDISFAVPKPK